MKKTLSAALELLSPAPFLNVLLWAVLIHINPAHGQFYEDFADSNFSINPVWVGDTGKFIINSNRELQLNAEPVSGSALLATRSVAVHQGRWEFRGSMAFNPSSVNLLDLVVMATDTSPNLGGQGYLIRLGGANDNIEFLRYRNGSTTRLGSWGNGWFNKDMNNFAIKVERYAGGIWYCYIDTTTYGTGSAAWIWLGSVTDPTYTQTQYVIVRPLYTSTRSKLFAFRQIVVTGSRMPDSVPPFLKSASFVNANQLNLLFSEPIDTIHAALALLIQQPFGLTMNGKRWNSDTVLEIEYSQPFPMEQRLTLRLSGLRDNSGLPLDTFVELVRNHYRAGRLRISEFMSDPDPPVQPAPGGLPRSEYVEIYNPDSLPLLVRSCSFGDMASIAAIPDFTLPSHGYALLVPSYNTELWQQWSAMQDPYIPRHILGIQAWPSLNQDEDRIRILGPEGITMDSLTYQLAWWRTPQQKQGGWSLTRSNLHCPCQDSLNWLPSVHPQGGDPGCESQGTDPPTGCRNLAPVRATQVLVDPNIGFRVQFASPVRPATGTSLGLIMNGDSIPIAINKADTLRLLREWLIPCGWVGSMQAGLGHTILSQGWESCNGTSSPAQYLPVGLGLGADSAKVLISEVYPRPLHTEYPWVECCNLSGQVLDRSRLWFFRTGPEGEVLEGNALGQEHEVWFPGQCLLLSRNTDFLEQEGLKPCWEKYANREDHQANVFDTLSLSATCLRLPALPRTGAWLSLQDHQGRTLDRIAYHDTSFHPWAGNLEGRSLQRWPHDQPYTGNGLPPTQWISSSSQQRASAGCFSTSTRQDPYTPISLKGRRRNLPLILTLSNQILLPGDLAMIRIGLQLQDSSISRQARVNIRIMDLMGRTITHLCQSEWSDMNSTWSWDGRAGNGSGLASGAIVPDGAYPVYLEWQNDEGQSGWDLTEIYVLRIP